MKSIIPDIDFSLNTNGITIYSEFLNTPRFVPFDNKGRCNRCKSDNVEFDFAVHDTGIIIYCSRFKKEVFVAFDIPMIPTDGAFLRVKSRLKSFNIPLSGVRNFNGLPADVPPINEGIKPPPSPPVVEPQDENENIMPVETTENTMQ